MNGRFTAYQRRTQRQQGRQGLLGALLFFTGGLIQMGQYYRPAIIAPDGRMLPLHPSAFGGFSKLTEHAWISNEFVSAVCSLIYKSPKRVAWIGDYAYREYETCGEAYTRAMSMDEFQKYYDTVWGKDSESLTANLFSKRDLAILDYDTKRMFLINHDKRVYIDIAAYIRDNTVKGGGWEGWCMNPLPLLTACGNGRGGGDYGRDYPGYADVGVWAFDSLEYTDKAPDGYTEAKYYFDEHKEATA
jgi:hypothetical protein